MNILKIPLNIIISISLKVFKKFLLELNTFLYLRNGKKTLNFFTQKNKEKHIFACFTQTYGNNRILEIKLLNYDKIGKYLRHKCDYIVFSFRDCSEDTIHHSIQFLEGIFPKEKLIFIKNNSLTYKESLLKSFKKMKSLGVTDIVLMQDDMYGLNNKINQNYEDIINSIFKGYKSLGLKWLHLLRSETINPEKMSLKEHKVGKIKFYKYLTSDFKKHTPRYSWNDGTFIADLEFLMKLYFHIGFYAKNSPWLTEYTIKQLMDNYKFTRYGINKHLFDTALIHGKHTVATEYLIDHLFQFFPEEFSKDEFLLLIKKNL